MKTFEIHVSRKIGFRWSKYGPIDGYTGYLSAEMCFWMKKKLEKKAVTSITKYRMAERQDVTPGRNDGYDLIIPQNQSDENLFKHFNLNMDGFKIC